jgi:hypothetical protein
VISGQLVAPYKKPPVWLMQVAFLFFRMGYEDERVALYLAITDRYILLTSAAPRLLFTVNPPVCPISPTRI